MDEGARPSQDAVVAAIQRLEKSLLAAKEVEISVLRQLAHTLDLLSKPLEQIANHTARLAGERKD